MADMTKLKALLFDVDGVLTDNGLWVGENGEMLKRFDIRDGAGIKLAQLGGLTIGLISGHQSRATVERATRLGIDICHVGVKDKVPVFEKTLEDLELAPSQVLYMGDDVMDLPLLRRAGVAVTVPEAPQIVRDAAHVTTTAPGGRGAVREIIEAVLSAQGKLDEVLQRFA